jgi:hypothetical protein
MDVHGLLLYVGNVRTSQEAHLWTVTACYAIAVLLPLRSIFYFNTYDICTYKILNMPSGTTRYKVPEGIYN